MTEPRPLELLAPAKDYEIAKQAILHGADAVYIGPPGFGARNNASNSLDDLRRLTEFAHPFRAKVYATVNTILRDSELKDAERMIRGLYKAGIDALIVQDMGILRLDIPPIPLHASTQCHISTPEKALFLEKVGFSQLVLARELSEKEIAEIAASVSIPIEVFVHGALCVSYSGRCHASHVHCGRSANRGKCAQLCRLPYSLSDAAGKVLIKNKHLLSLKDFNQLDSLESLAAAGASSFKIEGRLKDASYVKNIVSSYRNAIDHLISKFPEKYKRASFGESKINFVPEPAKSFNRGFTHYFYTGKADGKIASIHTPKSLGEPVKSFSELNNGDGIAFFDKDNNYIGLNINRIEGSKILNVKNIRIPSNSLLHRTYNRKWETALSKETAERKLDIDVELDEHGVTARDVRGIVVRVPIGFIPTRKEKESQDNNYRSPFAKLGNTNYRLRRFTSSIAPDKFIPVSVLTSARRNLIAALDRAAASSYPYSYREPELRSHPYPIRNLSYKENIANSAAKSFYREHGAVEIEDALEVSGKKPDTNDLTVMTTRYCILNELGLCKRTSGKKLNEPLFLSAPGIHYRLKFDCGRCGMELIAEK